MGLDFYKDERLTLCSPASGVIFSGFKGSGEDTWNLLVRLFFFCFSPLKCNLKVKGCFQAKRAILGSERGQLQARLAELREQVEASQQAMAALQSRNLTGEALLSKVSHS